MNVGLETNDPQMYATSAGATSASHPAGRDAIAQRRFGWLNNSAFVSTSSEFQKRRSTASRSLLLSMAYFTAWCGEQFTNARGLANSCSSTNPFEEPRQQKNCDSNTTVRGTPWATQSDARLSAQRRVAMVASELEQLVRISDMYCPLVQFTIAAPIIPSPIPATRGRTATHTILLISQPATIQQLLRLCLDSARGTVAKSI